IAVDARCRRRGIGAIMLNEIGRHSLEDGMDTTGASFGATAGLLNFWCQCGYRPVRLGMRRDTASGTHSVMLLAPITDTARQVAERLRPIAARHLHYHLPRRLAGLEPAVTVALLGALPCPPAPGADDWREVWAMAHGNRGIADAAPGLAVVLEHALGMGTAARLPAPRLQLLVHIILQGVEPAAAAPRFGLSGRRAVEAELRDGARTMLRIMGPERLQPSTE
ncbi:MAG TPA: GNAT family N-acetyltransferase, partial [Gammaproteobacteria bacterium]|nr:GNAT family N-acetyltransferase [Gammaproteobacteria bacterium]